MKVLITGAGGFIGSHLVDACVSVGHHVIAVDRKLQPEWIRGKRKAEVERSVDVAVPSFGKLYAGTFDLCYHLAAESRIQPSFDSPIDFVWSNVLGTSQVLEAARENGAKVVYAGSSTADDDVTKNIYATTKRQGEDLCRTYNRVFGIPVVVTRFYNVYGPRHVRSGRYATVVGIFERQYEAGEKLTVTGIGRQRRDFTHVDDIVSGMMACAEKGAVDGRVYSLGTGRNNSILEVARMFVKDERISFIARPPGEAEITKANINDVRRDTGWLSVHWLENYVRNWREALDGTD